MATLEKIRNKAGLLIAIVGLALFSFIIGDFLTSGRNLFGASKDKVGRVNGTSLPVSEFQQQVTITTEVMRSRMGQNPKDGQARDFVWDNFVNEVLLDNQAEEIGLTVPPSELSDLMFGANPHPIMYQIPEFRNEQGTYDPKRVAEFYKQTASRGGENQRAYWLYWEKTIKTQMLIEKLQSLLVKAVAPTEADMNLLSDFKKQVDDILCIRKAYYSIPDSVITVTDKEIQAKYDSDKENDYKTEGYRDIRTIVFDVTPSPEDYTKAEENIKGIREQLHDMTVEETYLSAPQMTDVDMPFDSTLKSQNEIDPIFREFAFSAAKDSVSAYALSSNYYKVAKVLSGIQEAPDSVRLSYIVIRRSTEALANVAADSVKNILNSGAPFELVAQRYSIDPNVKQNNGDIGWITEKQMGDLSKSLLTGKVGDIITHTISPQQGVVQLLKITQRTALKKKVRLGVISCKIEPSNKTYRDIYNRANQFIISNKTLETFEAAAKEQNLMIRSISQATKNQSIDYSLEDARPIIKWAWENKKGTVSDKVFTVSQYQYAVAAVSEAVEKGYIPLNVVSEKIKSELIKEKKAERLINDLKNVTDLSTNPPVDTLRGVSFTQAYLPNIGKEPAIQAAAYLTQVNQISKPIKGNTAVFMIQVLDKKDAPADATAEMQQAKDMISQNLMRGLFESLKKDAKIEDNRYYFY